MRFSTTFLNPYIGSRKVLRLLKIFVFSLLLILILPLKSVIFDDLSVAEVHRVEILIYANPHDTKVTTSFTVQELETAPLPYTILQTMDITMKPKKAIQALLARWNTWIKQRSMEGAKLTGSPLIVFADGRDVLFNPYSGKDLVKEYSEFNSHIIISCEPNCAPPEFCRTRPYGYERYGNSAENDVYVNSGLIIGTLPAMLYAYLWMEQFSKDYSDDQSKLHEFYLNHRDSKTIYSLKSSYWTAEAQAILNSEMKDHVAVLDRDYVLFDNLARHTFYYAPVNTSKSDIPDKKFQKKGCVADGEAKWNHRGVAQCNILVHNCIRRDTDCESLYNVTQSRGSRGRRKVRFPFSHHHTN